MAKRRRKATVGKKKSRASRRRSVVVSKKATNDSYESDSSGPAGDGSGGTSSPNREGDDSPSTSIPRVRTDNGEYRLGEWPYRIVSDLADLAPFSQWLAEHGNETDKTPVGIALKNDELALCTRETGWVVPVLDWVRNPKTRSILEGVLITALCTERTSPALITRSISALVDNLSVNIALSKDQETSLINNTIHEMEALSHSTGKAIVRELPALTEALDAATVGPMLALEAPRFYGQVGMPLARWRAHRDEYDTDDLLRGRRWTLTFDWLLFKLIAHYTQDPSLSEWLRNDVNPLTMMSQSLELDQEEVIALILWMCCGEDENLLSHKYPEWATKLPDNVRLLRETRVNKILPTLRLGLLRLFENYQADPRAQTLYGRRSPWGMNPKELLHFTIMGSITDILDVLLASLPGLDSTRHWLERGTKYAEWLRTTFVGYTENEPMEWESALKSVARLNNPLNSVMLNPKIHVE